MRILETDNWSLLLPPEWQAEQDDESVVISDRDGVGCLEISVLLSSDQEFSDADVKTLCEAPEDLRRGQLASCAAWSREFEEDDAAIREWFVAAPGGLAYITYSCALDNRGLDDAAVDDILSTLRLALEP